MPRFWVVATLLVALISPATAVTPRGYVPGKIITIEERTRDRVLLYQVNTPIMTVDHYLAVTLQVNGMRYEGEYMPRHANDPVPVIWKADDVVQARIEKHYFFVKRPDGAETRFEIIRKSKVSGATGPAR